MTEQPETRSEEASSAAGGYTNTDFNPSNDERADNIKKAAEALAIAIEQNASDGALKRKAILDVQSASMFAVKSLFTIS